MTFNTSDPLRLAQLAQDLLNAGYSRSVGRVVAEISDRAGSGLLKRRLREFADEAKRLAAAGERFDPQNPILRALVADFNNEMVANARRVRSAASGLQRVAIDEAGRLTRQMALPGLSDAMLEGVGIAWNTPDPAAVDALVNYIENPAWAAELEKYPVRVMQVVDNTAIRGFAEGWGPLRTSTSITQVVTELPVAEANNLMRTLYMQSVRRGQTIHRVANSDILSGHIRISARDGRVCLACIAEHGRVLAVNETVWDHHSGRCTSIPQVIGRERTVQSGEDWFFAQSDARQRELAGHANYEALKSGDVRLRDFVERYDDPVFGEMIRESSLKNLMGAGAREYYLYG